MQKPKVTDSVRQMISDIVNKSPYYSLEDEDMETLFQIGAWHGLWGLDNYGDYDRQNTVYGFLETLSGIFKENKEQTK